MSVMTSWPEAPAPGPRRYHIIVVVVVVVVAAATAGAADADDRGGASLCPEAVASAKVPAELPVAGVAAVVVSAVVVAGGFPKTQSASQQPASSQRRHATAVARKEGLRRYMSPNFSRAVPAPCQLRLASGKPTRTPGAKNCKMLPAQAMRERVGELERQSER
jgi:hypothetical protein